MEEAFTADGVRFGVFEVDLRSGELRKAGRRVALQDQPFRILARLVQRPGELVTREQLRQELWPVDTFVDFEHGLNAAIKRLRDALGDSADTPRFIETVPRRGYRFIAPVDGVAAPHRRRPHPVLVRIRRSTMALVLAVSLAGIAWMVVRRNAAIPVSEPLPLTSFAGSESMPALSPDGRHVAFLWRTGDAGAPARTRLCVMAIGASRPLVVSEEAEAMGRPAWSPDGTQLAILRHGQKPPAHDVILVSALGGLERRVGTIMAEGHGIAWSTDGRFLIVPHRASPGDPDGLFKLSLATGDLTRLTSPPADWAHDMFPAVAPDGRTVAFARGADGVSRGIFAVSIEGGEPRALTALSHVVQGLDWLADGNSIVFGAGVSASRLWRVAVSGGDPERLPFGEGGSFPSVARAGGLAYTRYSPDANLWRVPGPASPRRGDPERLIASTRLDLWPLYSPDGRTILFESDRTGAWEPWVCSDEGEDCRRLVREHSQGDTRRKTSGSIAWSPLGSTVAVTFGYREREEIHVVTVDGGVARRVAGASGLVAGWSRDARWIYFHPLRPEGRANEFPIWKVPSTGGTPTRATDSLGVRAIESEDGRYLYFQKGTPDGSVWRVALESQQKTQVLGEFIRMANWAVWRNVLVFLTSNRGPTPLIIQRDLGSGHEEVLARVGRPGIGLTVSPDGQWVVYTQQDEAGADLMFVGNFR